MQTFPRSAAEFHDELALQRLRFEALQPELEVVVRDPDLGVEGYVVVWNTGISRSGPLRNFAKGGTRVTKDLSLDQVKRLARAMAQKNAAAGLPIGGAKSGLRMDAADPDYERKYRRFVELCACLLHENGGIFGGFGYDVGGLPPNNAIWACDQLQSSRCFTGKPIEMGGTNYDAEGMAGLGVAVAARTLLEGDGVAARGRSFSVQGAGAMGAAVVRYFAAFGGVLRCLSDPKLGGTWVFDAAPSDALIGAVSRQNRDEAIRLLAQEGRKLSSDSMEALYVDADVLFPCAMEDALRGDNAGRVRARYLSEGANNATTAEAYRILLEKGARIVPGIIANSGGVIAAFVELTSTVTIEENVRTLAKVAEAKAMTIEKISENVRVLTGIVDGLGVGACEAAEFIALRNIFLGFGGAGS